LLGGLLYLVRDLLGSIVDVRPSRSEFEAFVDRVETGLRVALTAVFGPKDGRHAAATALAFAWEQWDRVSQMDNPGGYLYRVGRSSLRVTRGEADLDAAIWTATTNDAGG